MRISAPPLTLAAPHPPPFSLRIPTHARGTLYLLRLPHLCRASCLPVVERAASRSRLALPTSCLASCTARWKASKLSSGMGVIASSAGAQVSPPRRNLRRASVCHGREKRGWMSARGGGLRRPAPGRWSACLPGAPLSRALQFARGDPRGAAHRRQRLAGKVLREARLSRLFTLALSPNFLNNFTRSWLGILATVYQGCRVGTQLCTSSLQLGLGGRAFLLLFGGPGTTSTRVPFFFFSFFHKKRK